MIVRPATASDLSFFRAMLYEAACWRPGSRPPIDEVLADPHIARYLEGWGREGDLALVAEDDGELLGAAWFRLLTEDEPGYGYLAPDIPELTIAVAADKRRRGVGTALLHDLAEAARDAGYRAISVSVEPDNPARRLYERAGFVSAGANAGAVSMVLALRPA